MEAALGCVVVVVVAAVGILHHRVRRIEAVLRSIQGVDTRLRNLENARRGRPGNPVLPVNNPVTPDTIRMP
jgi:hypothetical protein